MNGNEPLGIGGNGIENDIPAHLWSATTERLFVPSISEPCESLLPRRGINCLGTTVASTTLTLLRKTTKKLFVHNVLFFVTLFYYHLYLSAFAV